MTLTTILITIGVIGIIGGFIFSLIKIIKQYYADNKKYDEDMEAYGKARHKLFIDYPVGTKLEVIENISAEENNTVLLPNNTVLLPGAILTVGGHSFSPPIHPLYEIFTPKQISLVYIDSGDNTAQEYKIFSSCLETKCKKL